MLVDELRANSPDVRQLVIAYQELVGEGLDVALVMAGLPGAVSATLNDRVLTFLNRATKVELESLRLGDVDALFGGAFEQLGVSVSAEVRKRAAQATEGSPYLLQLVGHYLALYALPEVEVDDEVFNEAVAAARPCLWVACGVDSPPPRDTRRLPIPASASLMVRERCLSP